MTTLSDFRKILILVLGIFLFPAVCCSQYYGIAEEEEEEEGLHYEEELEYSILDETLEKDPLTDSITSREYLFARLQRVEEKKDSDTNWFRLMWKGKLELDNPEVHYPGIIRLFFKVYYWADKAFNGQDPMYVQGTGRRWKARLVSDNWVDSYACNLDGKMPIWLMSDFNLNAGAYVQFMAVSVGKSYNLASLFGRKQSDQNRMEFGFNCARFNIEMFYNVNNDGSYIRKFGEYNRGHQFKYKFDEFNTHRLGVNAMYFVNNNKYSHGAAYNFSRFQRISCGSPIVGFIYNYLRMDMDLSDLPSELQPYLTITPRAYNFHYNSYSFMVGYGYNWVLNPHILLNFCATPAIGWLHTYEDSIERNSRMLCLNPLARCSFTYNLKDFFVNFAAKFDGNLYTTKRFTMFSSIETAVATVGIRF